MCSVLLPPAQVPLSPSGCAFPSGMRIFRFTPATAAASQKCDATKTKGCFLSFVYFSKTWRLFQYIRWTKDIFLNIMLFTLSSHLAIVKYKMTGSCFKCFCLDSAFLNTVLFLVGISALISCCVSEPEHNTWNFTKHQNVLWVIQKCVLASLIFIHQHGTADKSGLLGLKESDWII